MTEISDRELRAIALNAAIQICRFELGTREAMANRGQVVIETAKEFDKFLAGEI